MGNTVMADKLAAEISVSLKNWADDIAEIVDAAADDVSKDLLSSIQEDRPARSGGYKKGWTRKKVKNGYLIYNKAKPQLTHLLEKGHAKRSGGRVDGIPHIKKNEEQAKEKFEDICKSIVGGGKG